MTWEIFLFLLAAVFCTVLSNSILRLVLVNRKLGLNFRTFQLFISKPTIIIAILLSIIASVSWAKTLVSSDISVAIPVYTSLVFCANLTVGTILFNENITISKVLGMTCILIGISLVFSS